MSFFALLLLFAQPWIKVSPGDMKITSHAIWESERVFLELEFSNEGLVPLCILKGDVFTEDMREVYGIYSDFMMVRAGNEENKEYIGRMAGGVALQQYLQLKPGEGVISKYDMAKNYGVVDGEFYTRNFISYTVCNNLIEGGLELAPMSEILGDIRHGDPKLVQDFYKSYIQLGGTYADTGWVKHVKK